MLSHDNLKASPNSTHTSKRVGRGKGSGKGTFSGRGCKGQGSRTGRGKFNAAFEGGQTPLFRRMPKKRGFTSYEPTEFAIVNVSQLQELADAGVTSVDSQTLFDKGMIKKKDSLLKLLGNGELTASVTVRIHKTSAQAKAKIEKAGGTIELL